MNYALKDSIAYHLLRSANAVSQRLNKELSSYDIAIEQRATLEIIKHEDNVNQTTIAKLLGKDKATISRSLSSLEKKELIYKEQSAQSDKRSNRFKLTDKGEEILEKTLPVVKAYRESLNTQLSAEEHKIFFDILQKIKL